ncbi:osmoprotectant transport system substrate-binding protein [Saccharothrix tamanrassetensis]|uniref:Osmoprotectant transport system substrate-binding protein n=1 Tax=Saccharothrix tamanrassetensis TaxID=1051531 RepID=A0A841CCV9_9PSEU|nr:ABC transporter substrate-binding protein [Saccharothrix tamanrassetensis]MBB5955219.1 osmoprotectant transport system substrate-binding protein [Saccharothrix tamanrassetensis]
MKRTLTVIVAAAALVVSACGSKEDLSGSSGQSATGEVVVGSADFTENKILAEIYAGALKATGAKVSVKPGIGARELVVKALQDKSLGVVPEYTGNLLNYFDQANSKTSADEVYTALKSKTPSGLEVLEKAEAEDKDVLVVTKATADSGVKSIADLGDGKYVLGAAGEWGQRWQSKIKELYGVSFKEIKTTDAGGPVTVDALKNGTAQVANLYTTSADIKANDFVELDDPKSMYPAQNIVPLLRSDALDDKGKAALNKVSAALTTENLAELVKRVDIDKETIANVAADFLKTVQI